MTDLIHKAVEWAKLSAKVRKEHANLEALVASKGSYCWQPKYDGVHAIIHTSMGKAYTREGNQLPSIQHIVDALVTACGLGHVFQGEVWLTDTPFKDISGAARRQSLQPQLRVVLYDYHPSEAFSAGVNLTPYWQRLGDLRREVAKSMSPINIAVTVPVDIAPVGGFQPLAQEYVKNGGFDGLIVRDMNSGWVAGPDKEGALVKVKPSVTLDLRCNGVIQGEGKHAGKLGAISVSFNGVNSCVGTGFSDQEREDFWEAAVYGFARDKHRENLIGKIVEVECMCVNPNGTLREPRFKAVRWDKSEADA